MSNTKSKIKKKAVIALVKKDCHVQGDYYLNGETCVIGKLALSAGVSKNYLKSVNGPIGEEPGENDGIDFIRKKIIKKFGLAVWDLKFMQELNDDTDGLDERRAAIVEYVEGL